MPGDPHPLPFPAAGSTRRDFLRCSLGLIPVLAGIPDLRAQTVRVAFLASPDDPAGYARGAALAATEAGRAAELLGAGFELITLTPGSPAAAVTEAIAAIDDGAVAIVSTVRYQTRAVIDRAGSTPILDVAAGSPPAADCPDGAFFTGVPHAEAVRALAAAAATREPDLNWTLLVRDDAAAARWSAVIEDAGVVVASAITFGAGDARAAERSVPEAERVLFVDDAVDPADRATALLPDHAGAPPVALLHPREDDRVHAYVAGWHPGLFRFGATQLNERFDRAYDSGMDSAAWAAWIAVKIVADVALRARGGGAALVEALAAPRARFDGHKGTPLSFRSPDRWLRQPLYAVWPTAEGDDIDDIDPGADPRPGNEPCPREA